MRERFAVATLNRSSMPVIFPADKEIPFLWVEADIPSFDT